MNTDYANMDIKTLHDEALSASRELRNSETKLIEIIGITNDRKSYLVLNCSNIFEYCEKYLQIKYDKAFSFIKLYEASKNIPALKKEIKKAEVGYTKLRTILPALKIKNEEKKENEVVAL